MVDPPFAICEIATSLALLGWSLSDEGRHPMIVMDNICYLFHGSHGARNDVDDADDDGTILYP